MKYLSQWNEKRRKNACFYNELFAKAGLNENGVIFLPREAEKCRHVYHLYTIRSSRREQIRAHLQAAGISSMVYYPVPLHLQEVYKDLGYKNGDFHISEISSREVLSLPMYPELAREEIEYIVQQITLCL